jgi:hypothetical protein
MTFSMIINWKKKKLRKIATKITNISTISKSNNKNSQKIISQNKKLIQGCAISLCQLYQSHYHHFNIDATKKQEIYMNEYSQ